MKSIWRCRKNHSWFRFNGAKWVIKFWSPEIGEYSFSEMFLATRIDF